MKAASPLTWAAIGALALWIFYSPPAEQVYSRVVVPAVRIIEREPQVEIRFVDRIVYRDVAPTTVATSTAGGEINVTQFCAAAVEAAVASTEIPLEPGGAVATGPTPPSSPPVLLLRSGSLDRGWFLRPDRLTLTGPLSTGGLAQADYRVRGDLQWVASGDSVIARQSRWWWVQGAVEALVVGGIGFGIGRVMP